MNDVIRFNTGYMQGELAFQKMVETQVIPPEYEKVDSSGGMHLLAESQSGHHHTVSADAVDMYRKSDDEFNTYLVVHETTLARHLKDGGHSPLELVAGERYRVRHQRQSTPEGYARVVD